MKYLIITLAILIYLFLNARKRPLPTESDLSHVFFPWMHLYYASKYFAPVKKAPWKSGFEEHFKENEAPENRAVLSNTKTVKMNAVGDVMIRTEFTRGDKSVLWQEIGEILFDADLTFGNLEFAVNNNRVIDRPIRFSIREKDADIMLGDERYGRFDVLSIANNHINDSFSEGIYSTMDYLDSKGIAHTGANKSAEDMDNFPIIERKGIKIAFLGYTFSTNGVPLEKDCQHGTNYVRFNALKEKHYDPSLIHRHIDLAKERGADLIVASLHWGLEFEYYPSERLVRRGRDLMERGVDIIIGHHPHILNPSEWYKTKDGRDTLCFYSLNGVTSQVLPLPQQNTGEIAGITIEQGSDSEGKTITRIKEADLTPTFFMRSGKGRSSRHRILPMYKTAERLDAGEKLPFMNSWSRFQFRYAEKEYRKYFVQKAFKHK